MAAADDGPSAGAVLRALSQPDVPVTAILDLMGAADPVAAVDHLFECERDRAQALARGLAATAAAAVLALIGVGFGADAAPWWVVATVLVLVLPALCWAGWLLVGLHALGARYAFAVLLISGQG